MLFLFEIQNFLTNVILIVGDYMLKNTEAIICFILLKIHKMIKNTKNVIPNSIR